MGETLRSVVDILDESGEIDNEATFEALWSIMSTQAERIRGRFEMTTDEGYRDLASYEGNDGWSGKLNAYVGEEMDWMIHSWMGEPSTGFSNMHLTCWLGPQTRVPHLAFAWGTLPTLWFYQDYLPRVDLCVDYDYLQRYYGPNNEQCLELRADEGLSWFTSRTLVVRQHVTESASCFVVQDADEPTRRAERIGQIAQLAEQRVTDWLAMVDAAEAVPVSEQAALSARDLHLRRLIAETDPANALGVRFFGEDLTDRLVGALWGAERRSERAPGGLQDPGS